MRLAAAVTHAEMQLHVAERSLQLQAMREEMGSSLTSVEKKWVDIAQSVEASVEARIQAEGKLHTLTEEKVATLRDASAQAHADTVKMVGALQQTAIDHSEVLRRLDADLSTFRVAAETKQAEESIKVQRALESAQQAAQQAAQYAAQGGGGGGVQQT